MYNRYIPQPDGSYRRCRQPDSGNRQDPTQKESPGRKETPVTPPNPPPVYPQNTKHAPQPAPSGMGFLRQLLPRDFDTGDLIVILLLLLMAGDNEESRSNAILTIALYILM